MGFKPTTVCRISGTPFCFISGMGGSVLTVGVELLDAVVNFLVAAEYCADGALEGEAALGVVEGLRVLAEVEFAGLRVFA